MITRPATALLFAISTCWLTGCGKKENENTKAPEAIADPAQNAAAGKLRKVEDPCIKEINVARMKSRQAYNNSRFDELESLFKEARESKARFRDGSWKLAQTYESLACHSKEPESMWELHDKIHEAWVTAKPDSVAAKVAQADFFVSYAWHARGSGFANTVPPKAWKTFEIRMSKAAKILEKAKELGQTDAYYWTVLLEVGKGQAWKKNDFDAVVEKAVAEAPQFYPVDLARASTLMPRWYGEEGDWEAYALQASERPGGLGAETYARIVIELWGYHDNIFQETKVSWPRTKEGLQIIRKQYPDSIDKLHTAALFSVAAGDREYAKELFGIIGDTFLPGIWRSPEQFLKCRHWAETGEF